MFGFGFSQTKAAAARAKGVSWPSIFRGTGRVALFATGRADILFGSFGDGAQLRVSVGDSSGTYNRLARRAGNLGYVLAREMSANVWIGYEITSVSSAADAALCLQSMAVYRPFRTLPITGATDSTGGNVDYRQNVGTTEWVEWDVGASEAQATCLGAIVGYRPTYGCLVTVAITDSATGLPVVPNVLPTASQWAARTGLSIGSIDPAAYVFDTSYAGKWSSSYWTHIPIATELPPGRYVVRYGMTTVSGTAGQTGQQSYIAGTTYSTASMTHDDVGAELMVAGWIMAPGDVSANDTFVLSGYATGYGTTSVLSGGGHGHDHQTSASASVDGNVVTMRVATTTRARTSGGVVTIGLAAPLTAQVGDAITVTGMGATGYNCAGAIITAISSSSVSYQAIGWVASVMTTAEGTTTDAGGLITSHRVVIGTTSARVTRAGYLTHPNYASDATAVLTYAGWHECRPDVYEHQFALVLSVAYTVDNSFFGSLASIGCGHSDWGYGSPGPVSARPLEMTGMTPVTLEDSSEMFTGQHPAFVFIHPTGLATVAQATGSLVTGWNNGQGRSVVQARSASLKKAYWRFVTSPTALPAGTSWTVGLKRWDAVILDPSPHAFLS